VGSEMCIRDSTHSVWIWLRTSKPTILPQINASSLISFEMLNYVKWVDLYFSCCLYVSPTMHPCHWVYLLFQDQDHRDLEARIATLFSRSGSLSKHSSSKPSSSGSARRPSATRPSPRRHHKTHLKTQPYSETDEQVMDDEELHSLLGV